jgi:hypothetical protein
MKYESHLTYRSKDVANVKFLQTDKQTDKQRDGQAKNQNTCV